MLADYGLRMVCRPPMPSVNLFVALIDFDSRADAAERVVALQLSNGSWTPKVCPIAQQAISHDKYAQQTENQKPPGYPFRPLRLVVISVVVAFVHLASIAGRCR